MWCCPRFYTKAFAFFIFVNDLNNSTKVLDPVLFVDNTNLFWSNSDIRAVFETANQELDQISDWFLANKLSLNVEKTKYMSLYKLTDQENIHLKLPPLQLNGNITERENSLKFLVVILDECLIWKKNIYSLLKLRSQKTLLFFIKQVAMSDWFHV